MGSEGRWVPQGILLPAPPQLAGAASHAALPSAHEVDGQWWLYFSTRDADKRSSIARVALSVGEAPALSGEPELVLGPGRLGTFDDSGVTHSCLVADGGRLLLYYSGWSLGRTVPFYCFAGCAVSEDGGHSFERVSEAPILERSAVDPFLTASPWVLREDGRWRMWYVSCVGWTVMDGKPRHHYHLKLAESDDGIAWRREGIVAVDFGSPDEYALARPCVVRDGDRYRMWLCARGDAYRLAYAESPDGIRWERDDAAVSVPRADWDAEMQAYPSVLDVAQRRFLLYNGNGYGATGIGYAALERS